MQPIEFCECSSEVRKNLRRIIFAPSLGQESRLVLKPNLSAFADFLKPGFEPFAFAGIWELARSGGEEVLSAAMIVGEPNPLVEGILSQGRRLQPGALFPYRIGFVSLADNRRRRYAAK
jgi:hypothetical protein